MLYRAFILFLLFSTNTAFAQNGNMSGEQWVNKITGNVVKPANKNIYQSAQPGYALYYTSVEGMQVPYLIYIPASYKPDVAMPVVVFLHGAILARDSFHHKDPTIAEEPIFSIADPLNTIVVFPFSKSGFAWPAQTAACENIITILHQVAQHYKVDAKRVYIGGISMGGIATFWFITHKASEFAGFYTFSALPRLGNTPITFSNLTKARSLYSINAKDDPVFPYNEVHELYEQHKQEAPGWVFKSVESGGHRFIYNGDTGKQIVRSLLANLLIPAKK